MRLKRIACLYEARRDSDNSSVAAKLQRFGSFRRKALYKYDYLFICFIFNVRQLYLCSDTNSVQFLTEITILTIFMNNLDTLVSKPASYSKCGLLIWLVCIYIDRDLFVFRGSPMGVLSYKIIIISCYHWWRCNYKLPSLLTSYTLWWTNVRKLFWI